MSRPWRDARRGRLLAAVGLLLALSPSGGPEGPSRASQDSDVIAITGGTVHTLGAAGTVEGATVLVAGGRIRAVGQDVSIPPGARRIDAAGKVVTPGLMDSFTRLGLVEVGQIASTRDFATDDGRITAAFDPVDGLNPRSTLIPINRVEGLTRAVVAPAAAGSLIAGRVAVIHLGMEEDLVVRTPVALFAVLGEAGARRAGGARAAALLRLREALQDARDFATNREAFARGERRDYALSRLDLEALAPVAAGKLPLVLQVERASDIHAALRLAREEKLRLILAGAVEGWMAAEAIAAAKVPVLLEPLTNRPDSFEALGSTLQNAARLRAAGVTVAFMTGSAHNARNLKQSAGNTVAAGLPWEEALRAMTAAPAAIWGIADRYGTLEPGKEADVVVWDGDPLEVTTFAEVVLIRGREVPMETRQQKLRERYRRLDGDLPPAYVKP